MTKKEKKEEILCKLADINDKNKMFYDKKAELEKEILFCDLQIYKLMGEYAKLLKKLLT